MTYPVGIDKPRDKGPRRLGRLRGTNPVELNNKYGEKATTGHVSRQSSKLTHRWFMIFVFLHNLKCDKKIEHITGKKARSRDWFLKEALAHDVSDYVMADPFPDEDYPLPYDPKEHFEPVGEEYQRYNEWEKIDSAIKTLKNSLLEEETDNDVQGGRPNQEADTNSMEFKG
jgi:hypothetical protein